jgi:hypothetical protein
MEELGLLEQLMPWLSAHLKAEARPLIDTRTTRNLAALGETISTGASPPHEVVLAAMFLDMMTAGNPRDYIPPQLTAIRNGRQFDLVGELRKRGFARADTDFMRLIVEAFPNLMRPSRRTRKLIRRPYFENARRLFEIVGATYSADVTMLTRFLADPLAFLENRPEVPDASRAPRRRKRRGRRRPPWQRETNRTPTTTSEAPPNGIAPDASDKASEPVRPPHPYRTE